MNCHKDGIYIQTDDRCAHEDTQMLVNTHIHGYTCIV